MPTLLPFRDYDEKDVINLYTFSGNFPVNKGTIVTVLDSGFVPSTTDILEMIGYVGGANGYPNTVSQRFGAAPKVGPCAATNEPLGMLLYDGRETDENGEKLVFKPRKAAEMEVFVTGQVAPIVTRGIFLYSGVAGGNPLATSPFYVSGAGQIGTGLPNGLVNTGDGQGGLNPVNKKVGKALGAKDINGHILFKLEL